MDVEMELNGHSPPLKMSSEFDTTSHDASNFTASMSNSENTLSSLPQKTFPIVPVTDDLAPVQSPPVNDEKPQPNMSATTEPAENGHHQITPPVAPAEPTNGISEASRLSDYVPGTAELSHQPEVSSNSAPSPQPATSTQPFSSFDVLSTEPSLLTEPLSVPTAMPPLVSGSPAAEVSSILNQATISDLRTSPSAAAVVSSDEAMQMRAEKEQQDIASDPALAQALSANSSAPASHPISPAPLVHTEVVQSRQDSMLDEGVEMDTSFDNAPVVEATESSKIPSPPPAPEPKYATLPSEQPQIPASSAITAPLTVEQPEAPAPTSTEPQTNNATPPEDAADETMTDVVSPPANAKMAREREDDEEDSEPLAKRAKTEVETDQSDFKVPGVPNNVNSPGLSTSGEPSGSVFADEDDSVTQPRLAQMKKIISNLKKSKASMYFRTPVDTVALNIPQYNDIIKNPMDLSKIDTKLKNSEYTSVHQFIADFELIVHNTTVFNGREHGVTLAALTMQTSFNNQMANMPKAGVVEPSKEEKRAQKLKVEATRVIPQRRPSISAPAPRTGLARSPSTTAPAQTFAVGPEGVPLIRRDSNVNDGRPKRAIIPPKRNSEFGTGSRPKKKKYELQLKFCQEVLKELKNGKNWQYNQYFTEPVDPVALNIPTYFQVIKKPMDLFTIQQKMDGNAYEKAKDFEEDVRLIFKNCYKFNPEGEWVNTAGHRLEEIFDKKWETKDDWLASREPTSEPQSGGEDDDDDEESEEDEEEEESDSDDRNQKIVQLQKQIEAMSKQMGELAQPKKKKKATPPVPAKKTKSKSSKKEKQGSTFPNLKPKDKKKSSSKSKPEKERYVNISFAEKQYISNGISQLPDKQMSEALKIIQNNVPRLQNTSETEIELDIEDVPNHVLQKLLVFVKKYAGPPPEEPKSEPVYTAPAPTGGSGRPKKNKPMSKDQQEAQIEELKGKLGQYASGGASPDAHQSIETGADSSDDDDADSEESEEE